MNLRQRTSLIGGLVLAGLLGSAYLAIHLFLHTRSGALALTPAQQNELEFWLAITFAAVFLAFSVAGLVLMDRLLLQRLFHLEQDVAGIAAGSSLRIQMSGSDEIASLGRNIDQMVESLRRTTEELRRTRDIAERAEAAKTRLLASASHEMRTPLNGILGLIGLLRHSPSLSSTDLESLNMMDEAGNQLLLKVNTLLDHSLLETGSLALQIDSFSLEELLRRVIDEILPETHRKSLSVHVEIDAEVPPILLGDANRLAQVLRHLLNNAVKFTVKGELGIHVRQDPEAASQLAFDVLDTGSGIAASEQEAIFHPFEHPRASKDSMGLGLSICRMLAELMEGRIELESRLGEGSRFTFFAQLPSSASNRSASKPRPFDGTPALVVHHDLRSRHILADLLKRLGMEPQEEAEAISGRDIAPHTVIFWGLDTEPPLPGNIVYIHKRVGFDRPQAGTLLEPFFPSDVLEACNALLRPPLRIGLWISSAMLKSLVGSALRHAGHAPLEFDASSETPTACDILVTDAAKNIEACGSVPTIVLVSADTVTVPGAAAVLEKSAISSQLADLVERFRPSGQ